MRSLTALSPLDNSGFSAPPTARRDLGGVAAASGRRDGPAAKASAAGPAQKKNRVAILGPWGWALAGFALWGAVVGGRAQIVRLVPAAAPLYSAAGLAVNLRRMNIENVVSRLADEDGLQVLVVEG